MGPAIFDLSKTPMYEFYYDYMIPKYGSKVKLCYMDTDNFFYEIETEDFYRGIAKDVEKRFDTCGYPKNENRPLPIETKLKSDWPDERRAWWKNHDRVFRSKSKDVCV